MLKRKPYFLIALLLLCTLMLLTGCSFSNNKQAPVGSDIETAIPKASVFSGDVLTAELSVPVAKASVNTSTEPTLSLQKVSIAKETESKKTDKKKASKKSSKKKIVAIDAGHQKKGNYDKEPIGPGAKTKKAKVSSGTQGRFTKVPEYELTLVIAKKVKEELIDRGYEVVMIREKHDVDISNKERAEIATEGGADIFIRIHADGSENPSVHGTSTLYPSKKNPYVSHLHKSSYALAKAIVDNICENTGSKNRGAIARDDMSGINWSTMPVTIIEMGYMTNEKEDKLMQKKSYQKKIVKGICDGIDQYFKDQKDKE